MDQLTAYGLRPFFHQQLIALGDEALVAARVTIEHRGRYRLVTEAGEVDAELCGRLRHHAADRRGLPAVGDWVGARCDAENEHALVMHVLDRHTAFVRQAPGRRTEAQVVAANIDTVFVVAALNAELNANRLERYVSAVWESGATAVVVLNKADLCSAPRAAVARLGPVVSGVPVAVVSALRRDGEAELLAHIRPGRTVALVGSSGVGKSSLVNWLLDREAQTVRTTRRDDKGRHATTHRELFLLEGSGGILIDTPGMRELQLWGDGEGVEQAFDDIETLAAGCRFVDCRHAGEPGCAVQTALDDGQLSHERLDHHRKLERERAYQRTRRDTASRRAQERAWGREARAIMRHKRRQRG